MQNGVKTIVQIIISIGVLVYIVARIGMHTNQIRFAKAVEVAKKEPILIPKDVVFAKKYSRKMDCPQVGEVFIELSISDKIYGKGKTLNKSKTEGDRCSYSSGFEFEFISDSLLIRSPNGTMEKEAFCPLKCRAKELLKREVFYPIYQDTFISGNKYRILIFPEFEISER